MKGIGENTDYNPGLAISLGNTGTFETKEDYESYKKQPEQKRIKAQRKRINRKYRLIRHIENKEESLIELDKQIKEKEEETRKESANYHSIFLAEELKRLIRLRNRTKERLTLSKIEKEELIYGI